MRSLKAWWNGADRRILAAGGLGCVIILIAASANEAGKALEVVAAVAFVFVVARYPSAACTVLITAVLFNLVGLSLLLNIGLPPGVVKALSLWKLGIVAGLALAALRDGALRRLDRLDAAAIAYAGLGLAYLIAPGLFLGGRLGAYLDLYERALGWRGDVLYIFAFVVFRHLRLPAGTVDRLLNRFASAAVIMAAFGIFEAALPHVFDRLAVQVLGIPRYEHLIVGYQPSSAFRLDTVLVYSDGTTGVLRIGSLLIDYLSVGFVFAIGLGIVADRLARPGAPRRLWAAFIVLAAGTVLTETRSAIIAGGVAVLFALRRRQGKPLGARARLARILAAGLVVATPVALAAGLLVRFAHAPESNAAHQAALRGGITSLLEAPLGNGLATAEGGAQILLANSHLSVVTEDQYLQIGAVLGFPGLLLYVLVLGGVLRLLVNRRYDNDSFAPSAMSNAAAGCFMGAFFTQAFTNLELSLAFWALAGLTVGVVDQSRRHSTTSDRVGLIPAPAADR